MFNSKICKFILKLNEYYRLYNKVSIVDYLYFILLHLYYKLLHQLFFISQFFGVFVIYCTHYYSEVFIGSLNSKSIWHTLIY